LLPVQRADRMGHVQKPIYIPPQIIVERNSNNLDAYKRLIFGRKNITRMTYDVSLLSKRTAMIEE
jgi:hypothetical protein